MPCPSCELLRINGVLCHETGCPDAWRDETRECDWCGSKFKPEHGQQRFCDESCGNSFYGLVSEADVVEIEEGDPFPR